MRPFPALAAASLALCAAGCIGGSMSEESPHLEASGLADGIVPDRRVFFGHQSVGYGIVEGVAALIAEGRAPGLAIAESRLPVAGEGPCLVHAAIGRNGDPLGKIADFESLIRGGMGKRVDLALMKFCYVDITAKTDVDSLFAAYRGAMKGLKEDFPALTLVHVTAPLTARDRGLKSAAKRLLGIASGSAADNAARERFSDLLRGEYSGREPLFDLARMESAGRDGRIASGSRDGRAYPSLLDAYTDDGGHLNELGRRRAAEDLLAALAAASK